jgi:hypothetical protein
VKRGSAIFLLVILLVNSVGFYVYYIVQLKQIRWEMQMALAFAPEEKLEKISLTYKQYQLSKVDDHEIRIYDKMYDIGRIKITGDSVLVYCIHDTKEENLMAFLDEITSKPLIGKHAVPSYLIHFLVLVFLQPHGDHRFQNNGVSITRSIHYNFNKDLFSNCVNTPPPKG